MPKGNFDLGERLLDYSAAVIDLVNELPTTRSASHLESVQTAHSESVR